MKPRILLVEDETDLGNVVTQYLEVMDFEVDWIVNGKEAMEKLTAFPNRYQLILLDVTLPGIDGFELAAQLVRNNSGTPFLFLTARSERTYKLHGLKIGADDYITKPFDIDELVLRIRNIIRRHNAGTAAQVQPAGIEIGNIRFNRDNLKLVIDNQKEIILTPREAELLDYLFKHPNQVIKREEILVTLWGANDYFLGRSLDVFISRLRKHFGNNEYMNIANIYGVGFMLNVKTE